LPCFEQAFLRRVEVIARNVEVGERETLTRGLVREFVGDGDFAQLLAQTDRVRMILDRIKEARDGAPVRLIFQKQLDIEQCRLDIFVGACVRVRVLHCVRLNNDEFS
jgi:hypothetical protein